MDTVEIMEDVVEWEELEDDSHRHGEATYRESVIDQFTMKQLCSWELELLGSYIGYLTCILWGDQFCLSVNKLTTGQTGDLDDCYYTQYWNGLCI